jgi:hypothetical protein
MALPIYRLSIAIFYSASKSIFIEYRKEVATRRIGGLEKVLSAHYTYKCAIN